MVKKQVVDIDYAESLIKKAENRLIYIKKQKIEHSSSSFVFEDVYECMREAIQSLMALKGFKPYSHEAVISFLKEFFDFGEDTISTLNRYRILRNKAVYNAKKISVLTCREAIDFLIEFIPKIKKKFNKER